MKKFSGILVLGFFLMVTLSFQNSGETYPNEPDGFRGIKWGTNISILKDMQYAMMFGSIVAYEREGENLSFEGIEVGAIRYLFLNGKLFGGLVFAKSHESCKGELEEAVTKRFGEGKSEGCAPDYTWEGKRTEISLECWSEEEWTRWASGMYLESEDFKREFSVMGYEFKIEDLRVANVGIFSKVEDIEVKVQERVSGSGWDVVTRVLFDPGNVHRVSKNVVDVNVLVEGEGDGENELMFVRLDCSKKKFFAASSIADYSKLGFIQSFKPVLRDIERSDVIINELFQKVCR